MKSLQLQDIGNLNGADVPTPEAGEEQVLIKVSHCALCRTDAKMWQQGHRDLVLPRVLGHEICGVDLVTERRLVIWPGRACGACEQCVRGAENLCPEMSIQGFHRDGGLAEFTVAPTSSLIPVPDELPGEIACLSEPLACALNANEQAGAAEERTVLVYGGGPVGLMVAMAARVAGANASIVEPSPDTLHRSDSFRKALGISGSVEPTDDRFDIVINAAPTVGTFTDGIPRLGPGGSFCIFSGFTDQEPIPVPLLNEVHYRQLQVTGAYGCTRHQMREALRILAEHAECAALLIEDTIALEQTPEALSRILSGGALRFVIRL